MGKRWEQILSRVLAQCELQEFITENVNVSDYLPILCIFEQQNVNASFQSGNQQKQLKKKGVMSS